MGWKMASRLQHLLRDAASCGLLSSPQRESEYSAPEVALGITPKGLVGGKLVRVRSGRTRLHKVDALAWVLGRDVRQVGAVRIKDDELTP